MEPPPFKPTGTYEDLITLIVRLELRLLERRRMAPVEKPAWQRRFLEFPLNLVGGAVALILRLIPNSLSLKAHLKVYDLLTNYKYHSLDIIKYDNTNKAIVIYEKIKTRAPNIPILCLTSHPPVAGEIRDLNVGLMAAGSQAIRAVRGTKRPYRVLVAVDSMALDTLSVVEEGLYAGVMGLYDLGIDRYPQTRTRLQQVLFRRLHYERSAFRLAESLRKGENVVLVISGGVNTTARLLYTIREFLWSLRRRSKRPPVSVIADLSTNSMLFERFQRSYGSRLNPSRCLEVFFAAWLAGDPIIGYVSRETPACESGTLNPELSRVLSETIRAFGIPSADSAKLLADFQGEFSRITPYRLRFFQFLLRRVLPRTGAILIQPLDHSEDPGDPIQIREPLGIVREDAGFSAIKATGAGLRQESFRDAEFFRPWMQSAFKN